MILGDDERRFPTYCYDTARRPVLSEQERIERAAFRIDELLREAERDRWREQQDDT